MTLVLVAKLGCRKRRSLSQNTQEQIILYDQLITQAEEGMLPAQEV